MREIEERTLELVAKAIWSVSFSGHDDNAWDGAGVSDETRASVREEARAAILAFLEAYRLPCAVKLERGTTFGKNVPLSTLMLGLQRRAEWEAEPPPPTDSTIDPERGV